MTEGERKGLPQKKKRKNRLSLKERAKYILEPFNREEESDYYGGKVGLDIADPLDVLYSAATIPARAIKSLLFQDQVHQLHYGDRKKAGETIKSKEDIEELVDKIDPDGTLKDAGWTFEYSDSSFQPSMASPSQKKVIVSSAGYPGADAVTAAEEIRHAMHFEREPYSGFPIPMNLKNYPIISQPITMAEETRAKAKGLMDVFRHEGVKEGLASIPPVYQTWSSYALDQGLGLVDQNPFNSLKKSELETYELVKEMYGGIPEFADVYNTEFEHMAPWQFTGTGEQIILPEMDMSNLDLTKTNPMMMNYLQGYDSTEAEDIIRESEDGNYEMIKDGVWFPIERNPDFLTPEDMIGRDVLTRPDLMESQPTYINTRNFNEVEKRQEAGPVRTIMNWFQRYI